MFAFPEMLVPAAENAGIKVPKDLDKYDAMKYPHWHVYSLIQLGRPMPSPGCHWDNARVVAAISDKDIKKVTYGRLCELGFV